MYLRAVRTQSRFVFIVLAVVASLNTSSGAAPEGDEWRAYSGSNRSLKYSPLDQINTNTVKNLKIAWRQSAVPLELRHGRATVSVPTNFQMTPLMVGSLLYMTAPDSSVVALNPGTGKVVWTYVPPELRQNESETDGAVAREQLAGRTGNRGPAYWSDGKHARIITTSGRTLVALDAKTGVPAPGFGVEGRVDLVSGFRRPATGFRTSSPPLVTGNLIVVGGVVSGPGNQPLPGDIRAFDVRTGKPVWTFNVIPDPGEFGNDTWQNDSYTYAGASGIWGFMSADDELGYVYLGTENAQARGPDHWGAARPGNNLFAETILCIDARTGTRVWHYQVVHHGIWDYDLNAAPNLVDITVDGRKIKALAQVSKQAFVYVLDRVTGKPVWPIEERPVPKGDAPDEWYSPTQPMPTKPRAFDQQGVTIDDLIDFTPELRQEAIKILNQYRYGPLYTPASVADPAKGTKGTVQMPGVAGGANFQGAGVDPDSGVLFVNSVHTPNIVELIPAPPGADGTPGKGWVHRRGNAIIGDFIEGPQGLPIFKPPYGRLVAIDLNKGEILWTVANGDGPRDHPAIRHLNLPRLGNPGRAAPLVTKSLVFLGEGGNDAIITNPRYGGGKMFRAYDKATGDVVWEMELPGGTTGAPMGYSFNGKQYIVVAVGFKDVPAELIALALP